MSVKQTGQLGFADAMVDGGRSGRVLDRVSALVDWAAFERRLAPLGHDGPGRGSWPVLVVFRALIVQALYGLSDRETEEALADRLSFRRFCGLALTDGVPDHSVICRFRNALVREGVADALFAELDRQLEAAGMILKRGTMLDATLIPTGSARPKDRDGPKHGPQHGPKDRNGVPRDPDAGFARRQGKPGSVYGYKAHVGVDQGSGLIRSVIATPANVNDTTPADGLIRGDERVIWADAAYHTHARVAALKARGVKPRLARRPNKHHPELSPRLKRYNQLIARRRAVVETTFATWKNRMGLRAIRYLGLAKATGQITLVALAFNLRRWAALTA